MNIQIINGPNLNLLGVREKSIYGDSSFEDYLVTLRKRYANITINYYQSNVEGEIINKLHEVGFSCDGIVINAGAYTHTSVAISDAIAGIKTPAEMQGESFLPLLKGDKNANGRKEVYYHYYEYPEPHHVSPHFGLRTSDYLLIRFYKGVESWELFDLKKDPEELHNVYNDPKYQKTIADLKERLKQQILKYDDKDALEIFNKGL